MANVIDAGLSRSQRDVLLDLGGLISARGSIAEVFSAFAAALLPEAGCDFAMLASIEAQGRLLTVTGMFPRSIDGLKQGTTLRADEAGMTVLAEVPGGETAYLTADVPYAVPRKLSEAGFPAAWSTVLTVRDEAVAVFTAARTSARAFSEAEVRFLREATTLLGSAMRNDQHIAALERQAFRSNLLNDLAVLLNAGERVDALFDRMLQLLERAIAFDYILLLARDGDTLRVVGCQPPPLAVIGTEIRLSLQQGEAASDHREGVREYRPDRVVGPWAEAIADAGGRRGLAALLRDSEGVLGAFTLGRNRNVPFTPEERAFVEVVATLLKQAIANERRLRFVESEIARSQLLNELSMKLSDGESVEALFAELPLFLGRVLQFDYVGLAAFDDDSGQLRTRAWLPGRPDESLNSVVDPKRIGLSKMALDDRPVVEFALDEEPDGVATKFAEAGYRRSAIAKLHHRGALLGVLHLSRKAPVPFGTEELAFLEVVATLFTQAVASQLRIDRTIADATEQRAIADISAAAARERDVASLLKGMLPALGSAVPDVGVAFVFLEGDALLYCDASGNRLPLPAGPYARGVMEGEQVVVPVESMDGATAAAVALARGDGMHTLVLTPARSTGEVVGMLVVGTRSQSYVFSKLDRKLLAAMAQIVGPAMANVIAAEQLGAEAREQRVIAEIAAIAAREDRLEALVGALWQPLRTLMPRPFLAFGFLEGEEVLYPGEDGGMNRSPLDDHSRRALTDGQVHGVLEPGELPPGDILETYGVRAIAVTAARSGGEAIGLLLTGSLAEGYEFGDRELRLFRVIAQVIGPAMVNARAAAHSRIEAQDQGILADIGTAVAREADPMALLQAAVEPLRRIIPRPLLGYGHIEDGSTVYDVPGRGEVKLPITAIEAEAVRAGQLTTGPLTAVLPEGHHGHQWGVESAVATARYAGGVARGLLIVGSREPGFVFGDREL
ncbi:MAG TPA: GAF domain-containing protein, partial [Tepidiformaceae bacterium]|nr:GAF domain-containing protein [Tepidiformaceae bacterium]